MIDFFIKNYQWVIGGIAVPFIVYFLQRNREEIKHLFKMEQKGGKDSTYYQAQQMVVKHTGISVADVKEIALSVFKENFPKLKGQAEIEAKKNVNIFIDKLDKKISSELTNEEIDKFSDPDIQYVLHRAIDSNARKNSEELRENLSTLIVERVKNDDKDLKRIAYNEAITTIGKLTLDQLKILTLCFLLKYTRCYVVRNGETLNNYLNAQIKPFLDFKNTNAEFQHLQYTGCANISIGSSNLTSIIKTCYTLLFLNKIEKAKVDEITIEPSIKQQILTFVESENKYLFTPANKGELKKYLTEQSTSEDVIRKIITLYDSSIKPDTEIDRWIYDETGIGRDLSTKWAESLIKNMSLTSVGIIIAATHFEQVVKEKLNIDEWIN